MLLRGRIFDAYIPATTDARTASTEIIIQMNAETLKSRLAATTNLMPLSNVANEPSDVDHSSSLNLSDTPPFVGTFLTTSPDAV